MAKKVFLSHNSDDKPAVEKLAEKLTDAGFDPWLDKWNLTPGDPWQPALEAALKACDVCVVFLGPNLVGPWQNEEMQVVINRGVTDKQFRVVPVLLPNTPRGRRGDVPSFLANRTWVEFRDSIDDNYSFKRLVNSLNGLPTRPDKVRAVVSGCPYKGLETFDIGDAAYFYGRDALTDWLVADVRRMLESDREPRFLAIVGASGSGKSSVARAGLLYELQQGAIAGSDRWARIIVDHPGAEPIEKLATEGAEALGLTKQAMALEREFIDPIRQESKHANKLHLQAELALANRPEQRLLVFIDQFEEIFTACTDAELRQRFVDLLLHAARAYNGKVMIVITMRQDFLPRCAAVPGLYDIISGAIELIGDMSDDEVREAIVRPAALSGVDFSPSLATTLIKAVRKQPGGLPLLEYVLKKLWDNKTGAAITDKDYTEGIKGLEQALADHADDILTHRCGTGAQQQQVLSLLTRLVHISDADKPETDTRVRYTLSDVDYEWLKPFVDERLLIASSQYDAHKPRSAGRLIEVAHEALIRHWPKLQAASRTAHSRAGGKVSIIKSRTGRPVAIQALCWLAST